MVTEVTDVTDVTFVIVPIRSRFTSTLPSTLISTSALRSSRFDEIQLLTAPKPQLRPPAGLASPCHGVGCDFVPSFNLRFGRLQHGITRDAVRRMYNEGQGSGTLFQLRRGKVFELPAIGCYKRFHLARVSPARLPTVVCCVSVVLRELRTSLW